MTHGEAMKQARKKAGLSQYQLADLSGVCQSTIGLAEVGKVTPRLATVELLADALGISIDEYVGHTVRG